MRSITVQIPKPCHQPWADMQPSEQGRFCASCQKTVVDYTALSERELIRLLTESTTTGCGRFKADQLNRVLSSPDHTGATPVWHHWLSLLTMGLFSWQAAQAQLEQNTNPRTRNSVVLDRASQSTTKSVAITAGPTPNRILTGTVSTSLANGTQELLPGAFVLIRETEQVTTTDYTGAFSLLVPADLEASPVTIVVRAIGFTEKEVTVSPATKNVQISLAEAIQLMGEVIFTGEYTTTKKSKSSGWGPVNGASPPSRWQRFKSKLFHKGGE